MQSKEQRENLVKKADDFLFLPAFYASEKVNDPREEVDLVSVSKKLAHTTVGFPFLVFFLFYPVHI